MLIARIRRFALGALAAALAVAPLGAQQVPPIPAPTAASAQHQAVPSGPTIDRAAVGVRSLPQQPESADASEAVVQPRLGLGRARALMIVGFGAVIVGLLIGDDVGTLISVAGAAVGLYGLYHYLK